MDSRAEELLLAVREAPDDTDVRLVFADHIASMYPAHAALIVAQCIGVDDPTLTTAFNAELPEVLRGRISLERGFARYETWTLEANELLAIDPDVLFRIAPTCTALTVEELEPRDSIVGRMRRFDTLTLQSFSREAETMRWFAHSAGLHHLRGLGFEDTRFDDENLTELLQATAFPALEALRIPGESNDLDHWPRTLRGLSNAPFASTLRALDLSRGPPEFLYYGIVEILEPLAMLRDLDVSYTGLDASFAGLSQCFERLVLGHCELDGIAARALANSKMLTELRVFEAEHNSWDCDDVFPLLDRFSSTIESLKLGPLTPTIDDVRILTETAFPRLSSLQLEEYCWSPGWGGALANASWVSQLTALNLPICSIDADAARALAPRLGSECIVWIDRLDETDPEAVAILRRAIGNRLDV